MRFDWRAFDDLDARAFHDLLRLRGDVFVVEQGCVFPDVDGRDPDALHLPARMDDGRLAGTLRLFGPDHDGEPAPIGRVATAMRGTGLGRALMADDDEDGIAHCAMVRDHEAASPTPERT